MLQQLGYPSRRRRPLERAGTRFGEAVSACHGLAASRRRHDTFSLDDTGRFVLAPARRHVSHWYLLRLWSYTVEITVPLGEPPAARAAVATVSGRQRAPGR